MTEYGDIIVTAILRGGTYALMALGLSLVFGVMKIANFAHGEFYMLGTFFAFFVFTGLKLSPVLTVIAAALLAFVAGMIIERGIFYPLRLRSKSNWLMNTFLLTLGISIILQNVAKLAWGARYRGITSYFEGSMQVSTINVPHDRIFSFLVACIAIIAMALFLQKTKLGRAIRSVSMDETGASLVGVNLNVIHTLTFGMSCALAALAGACLLSINPAFPTMGVNPLYKSWFVMILVGMGNLWGSIVGGLIVGALETISYFKFGAGWQDVISLIVIIFMLIVKPGGIFARKGVKSAVE
jgi:branched-chain amino acid transport system permease protein